MQVNIDKTTAKRLKKISDLSHQPVADIIREFAKQVDSLIDEDTERISMSSFALKDKRIVMTPVIKMIVGSGLSGNPTIDKLLKESDE